MGIGTCAGGSVAKVERAIDPMDFSSIPRTKDFVNSLPENVRFCREHGEPVVIRESEISLNPGAGPPFAKAAFIACCEAALNNVLSAIAIDNTRR